MVKFGVQLLQEEYDFEQMKKAWSAVEELGFDSVWIYDHFYPMCSITSKYIFEAWTLLPALALETKQIRFGVLVSCNSYRMPAILAKIAATVDVISKGRLEFGIGAGWHDEEYEAYGIPFPRGKIRIEQLAEAVDLIKKIWTQEKASFQGTYYTINDLEAYPKPHQKPYPPLWIGGQGNKLLQLAAQHADYINFDEPSINKIPNQLKILKEYCRSIGKDYETLEKSWYGRVIIGENEEEAKHKARKFMEASSTNLFNNISFKEFLDKIIVGTSEQCIEKIQRYIDYGITYFIANFPFSQDLETHHIFIDKIVNTLK
jgi:F420-dependent oxidoreductase-like protein